MGTIGQIDPGAAKTVILGLRTSAAKELAKHGITAIAPEAATAMTGINRIRGQTVVSPFAHTGIHIPIVVRPLYQAVNTYEGTRDVHALILGRAQTGNAAFPG